LENSIRARAAKHLAEHQVSREWLLDHASARATLGYFNREYRGLSRGQIDFLVSRET
jgi:hypothetical protein